MAIEAPLSSALAADRRAAEAAELLLRAYEPRTRLVKRDMELVRSLLLQIEDRDPDSGPFEPEVEGVDVPTIRGHLILMKEAGLIEAIERQSLGVAMPVLPRRLTWHGHEFLDAIREDSVWEKTKEVAQERGVGWTLSALAEIAKQLVSETVKGGF